MPLDNEITDAEVVEVKAPKKDTRKLFYAVVSFWAPIAGNTTVLAEDEGHAKKVLSEMYGETKDMKIIDLYNMENSPTLKKMLEAPAPTTIN